MNISTPPSAALPPLPPLKEGGPSSDAMNIIKAMGGLQTLRRAHAMIGLRQQDNQRFPCMSNPSNHRDLASRFAAVMPLGTHKRFANLGPINAHNGRQIQTMRSSETPVRFHLDFNTETMRDGNEGSLLKDVWPHKGAEDSSQAEFLSRTISSSRLRTTMTEPNTAELEADEDAMSWRAACEDISSNHKSRKPSERGGLGADARRKNGLMWIEETSRPIPDDHSGMLRPIPNVELHHIPADFRYGTDTRERTAMNASQEHPVIANQALEVQANDKINWNTQQAWRRTRIDTNNCYRSRLENEIGLASDDTDMTFKGDHSPSQTTTICQSGGTKFAGTDYRSVRRDVRSLGEDIRGLADDGSNHSAHGTFRRLGMEISTEPKRGHKRRLPRSLAHKANLDRRTKRPRATAPTGAMRPHSVHDMEMSMDTVKDTNDTPTQPVHCFSPMDISCSRKNEHEAVLSTTEPNVMDTCITAAFRNNIGDQRHDVTIWRDENDCQKPVMHTANRSRPAPGEADGYGLAERGVMQNANIGNAKDGNMRRRTRNGFDEADKCGSFAEENMRDISQPREDGYSTREREKHAYGETGEYQSTQRDVMHDITSENGEANDPEWCHGRKRHAEEYDMQDISDANVEDDFSECDQRTSPEAAVRGSSEVDAMPVVKSPNKTDSVKRGGRTLKRVRNLRKRDLCKPAEQNGFKSRKRRMRRMGRYTKRRCDGDENEPMSIL